MIPHCAYCRFNGQQDRDTLDNRCKGLDRDPDDDSPSQPCRYMDENVAIYRHFVAVNEVCAEDAVDWLLVAFDRLNYSLSRIEVGLRIATKKD